MSGLNFEKLGKIGEGQYGVVYKARMVATGQEVALKRILIDELDGIPSTALREVSLLQDLKHQNIVRLIDVLHVENRFYLVFELLEMDLGQLLKLARPNVLPIEVAKSMFKQLVEGLYFCHTKRILHRDIKPQNLLLSAEGVLKLADFGLARLFSLPLRALTTEVVTLWYRPPEVLFADDFYSVGADVWSSGCVLVDLLTGKTLFQGDCEIGQIHEIFKRLGTPDDETWPGFSKSPLYRNSFPEWRRLPPSELYPGVCQEARELLDSIFIYDQGKRISSKHILKCSFLRDVPGPIPLRVLKEMYQKKEKQKTKVDPT